MIEREFLDYSAAKLTQYLERIEVCVSKLTDNQIWSRGHESENSVGNLCLHLAGNVRQWILAGVGDEPDHRDRDSEFRATAGENPVAPLRATVVAACEVIRMLPDSRLVEPLKIQNYPVTVFTAIYHVVEHFAQHTGQILFATKALSGDDLGFYRHLSQPVHSEKTP